MCGCLTQRYLCSALLLSSTTSGRSNIFGVESFATLLQNHLFQTPHLANLNNSIASNQPKFQKATCFHPQEQFIEGAQCGKDIISFSFFHVINQNQRLRVN